MTLVLIQLALDKSIQIQIHLMATILGFFPFEITQKCQ